MKTLKYFLATLLLCQSIAAGAQSSVPVQGQLTSRAKGPVPGISVSLVHPVLGRSASTVTDAYGRFGWNAIPTRPEPYYLEAYWGKNLIYRQPVDVRAPVQLQPIVL